MKRIRQQGLIGAALLLAASAAYGDEFHYNNILIGDRAAGMGGAYTAVSDDPSGMYYNPAGLAYVTGRSLSASVNAYSVTSYTFKGVYGVDWTRTSSALLPNFFGIVQPVGKVKVGFSYAVPDSSTADQDQSYQISYDKWGSSKLTDFRINFNQNASVTLFGPSAAVAISDDFAVGLTLYAQKRNSELIMNQRFLAQDGSADYWWNNYYLESDEWGIRPVVGAMWSPIEKFSVGVSLAKTFVVSSDILFQQSKSSNNATIRAVESIPASGFTATEVSSDGRRTYPWQASLGVAFFPSPSLLVSADLSYASSFSYDFLQYHRERETVLNGAVGMEYYVTPQWAIRAGFYTDFANTPAVDPAKTSQQEHVDLYGGTLSLSHFTKNTSLTLGGSVKGGSGTSQVLGNGSEDASVLGWTLFVSSSYSY